MLKQEFIYERAPFPSCHASTVVETSRGELLAAWFGGSDEGEPDVTVWLSRRGEGGWTEPARVAAGGGVPCWNPVLHQLRRGPLLLFYRIGPSPQTWTTLLKRSEDGGRTWSDPEMLPAGVLGPIKNKPFELENGTLVCGSSVESYGAWGCWVERTPDAGRSWTKHGPINVPGHLYGTIQPTVFGTRDGSLAMLVRTRDLHQMARATSRDGGRTWTDLSPIDLPQNNSGLDAVRLRDGRVVLVYNHTRSARTPLNLAVSRDMGRTWTPGPVLETEPGEYSYPAVIQGADGTVHVTYTWRRERIRYARLSPDDLPKG
ncbi:MAG: exo-alpha-sialidase [Armatimonadota bacterium]